ncbi:exosome complex exonuclease Rrp41 [Candidatus Woesearchaeota archaeon]|nr:exosome complex exonuclease Rrp41 [Candidatus Woesearchaeota archaeon]
MSYKKRIDGRKFDELRKIEAKVGVIPNADGSAYFKIGDTEAYACVYGPKHLYPKFLQNPTKGVLRCNYNMMPFSGSGDRVRPGPSRRSKEISLVTEKALLPVVNLDDFPNAVVDVFIEFPQTDAGSRCAGICAASMALADAGIVMKDLVAAVSVGKVDDALVVDLNYNEESFEGEVADIPVAVIPSTGEFTLLQMDGIIDKDRLLKALDTAKKVAEKIVKIQREALKNKFEIKGA